MTDECVDQCPRIVRALRRSATRRAIAGTVATCAAVGWLFAQEPPAPPRPIFAGGTDVVRLEVSVLDKTRRPVLGLGASDFTVFENGKERPVVAFTAVNLPAAATIGTAAASWVRDAPLDVVSNAGVDEGRLVTIAIDWSVRGMDLVLARRIALAAVDGLGPGDEAAILFSSPFSSAGVPQNFTADRSRLRARIDQAVATALVDKDSVLIDPEGYESGGCLCGMCTLEALTRVAEALRSVSQRPKVVLFIGTYARSYEMMGPPRPLPRNAGPAAQAFNATNPNANTCPARLRDTRRTFERAAGEANIVVHSLDAAGLVSGFPPLGGSRERERLDSLAVIPDMTGGRTVQSTNAPEALVPAILGESGSYYVLGFTPASTTADGKVRRLDVQLRPKGLLVKARNEYTLAPLSDVSAADGLPRALGSVLPRADVPLAVSAVPLIAGRRAAVVIVGRLEEGLSWPITLIPAAFNPRGGPTTSRRVTLRPVGGNGTAGPLGVVSALALEPGPYEVRVAAELAGGATGSVHTFVDMPDFAHEPLSMSGVLFHVSPEEVSAPRDEIDGVLPFAPTARRTFARTETVSVFAQVSQGTSRTAPLQPVNVRVRIVDAHDTAIRDERSVLAASQFETNRTANSQLSLPIRTLPPGAYLLTITAALGQRTAERLVRFDVR